MDSKDARLERRHAAARDESNTLWNDGPPALTWGSCVFRVTSRSASRYVLGVPKRRALQDGVVTRKEAARILGICPSKVSNLIKAGHLQRATNRMDGLTWRHQVEAPAAMRAAARSRGHVQFEDLMLAADRTRESPGAFVDTEGAAGIVGCTLQYVGRLTAQGRLPWLPTGRYGGQPTRVYRRAQIEVIASARALVRADAAAETESLSHSARARSVLLWLRAVL